MLLCLGSSCHMLVAGYSVRPSLTLQNQLNISYRQELRMRMVCSLLHQFGSRSHTTRCAVNIDEA
jgi:hypothetical protein